MAERKRFQNQVLNSEEYAMTEKGATAVKTGGVILTTIAVVTVVVKKYGPVLLKSFSKSRNS